MRTHRHLSVLAPLLLISLTACATGTAAAPSPGANTDPVAENVSDQLVSLRSRDALEAYLATHAGKATPFDALPALARRRFLDSLVFGTKGLGGFETADLAMELKPREIAGILSLLDAGQYASAVKSRHPDAAPAWRRHEAKAGKVETGFDELYRLRDNKAREGTPLRQRFTTLFAELMLRPNDLNTFPERELLYLMRSIQLVASDAPAPEDLARLQDVVAALEAHGIAVPQDHRGVYDRMLRLRRFNDARRYATEHRDADLPLLPEMVDQFAEPAPPLTAWRTNEHGQLLRTTLDLESTQILVTAGCHFSEDAAEDISRDPVLGPVFAARAHWLLLPPGQEDQEAVRQWNRRFPEAQALQVYDRSEWTMLPPGWSMPTFFVLRDGKVLERISGWSRNPEANRQLLIDALRRANLL